MMTRIGSFRANCLVLMVSLFALNAGAWAQDPCDGVPQAEISVLRDQLQVPVALLLSAVGSSDCDGTLVAWEWTIDGLPPLSGETVPALITDPGQYTIGLTVIDDAGNQGTASTTVEVLEAFCPIMPVTIEAALLGDVVVGQAFDQIPVDTGPGNFSELTWTGVNNEGTLAASLALPGDSFDYINSDDPTDHLLTVGDWVQGKPGVTNAAGVRAALDLLLGQSMVIPTHGETRDQGANFDYQVVDFVRIELADYRLSGQGYFSFVYRGDAHCYDPRFEGDYQFQTPEDTPLDIELPIVQPQTWIEPQHGALSGPGPQLTYTPAPDYFGPDRFTLLDQGDLVTVVIDVLPVIDPPIADPQSVTTPEDTPVAVTLTGSPGEGGTLMFELVSAPVSGVLTGDPPNLVYTPDNDFNGMDAFEFTVLEGGQSAAPATVSITVTPVNDAPVANGQELSVAEDQVLAIVLDGFDVDGDALQFVVSPLPANGTLSGTAPNLSYTPDANFFGTDSFGFLVNDGELDSVPASIAITVTPVNDAPLANPQSITVDEDQTVPVSLSGADVENDPLTFSVVVPPAHGTLTGSPPDLIYAPNPDFNGSDGFQFVANDGLLDSAPAAVTITVNPVNDPPVANDQELETDEDLPIGIVLTGSDVDGDALTFTLISGPSNGTLSGAAPDLTYTPAADFNGLDSLSFVVNDGTGDSDPATVTITVAPVNDAPLVSAEPVSVDEDTSAAITVAATDVDGDPLTYAVVSAPANGTLTGAGPDFNYQPDPDFNGADSVTVVVSDGTVDAEPVLVAISVRPVNDPPVISSLPLTSAVIGELYVYALEASDVDGDSLNYELTVAPPGMIISAANGSIQWTPQNEGSFGVTVLVRDPFSATAEQSFSVFVTAAALPPDPTLIAPPLDQTIVTPFSQAYEFIYKHATPVQIGVDDGAISPHTAAVVVGKVLDIFDQPLPGALITIAGHPEYGLTYSRADGAYDLVVNGGGTITIDIHLDGYLRAQRSIEVGWHEFGFAPDVQLTQLDSQVTFVDFLIPATQVVRGSVQADGDGDRQATLLIPPGTEATLRLPDGQIQTVTELNIRATEYTVGIDGPKRMPANLPSNSGYTYAVELSADEVIAAAARVDFNQALPFYVENFLEFEVGSPVPVGYYDFNFRSWLPSEDGRVIEILSAANGVAEIDVDGSGLPATQTQLDELGVTSGELERLAELYSAGQQLWRAPVTHFTPWDCNWPYGPPIDAEPPTPPERDDPSDPTSDEPDEMTTPEDPPSDDHPDEPRTEDDPLEDPEIECGSIIECETNVLGESIPIAGTPYSLNYRSNRTEGAKATNTLSIPLTWDIVPQSLKRADGTVTFNGRTIAIPPLDNPGPRAHLPLAVDGLDRYGRQVQGAGEVEVDLSYVYEGRFYRSTTEFARSFGRLAGIPLQISRDGREFSLSTRWSAPVASGARLHAGTFQAKGLGLGGWSVDVHHVFDPETGLLYAGGGSIRRVYDLGPISILAASHYPGIQDQVQSFALGPDGSLAYSNGFSLELIDPLGNQRTLLEICEQTKEFKGFGAGQCVPGVDDLIFDDDGNLFFIDPTSLDFRQVLPDGSAPIVHQSSEPCFPRSPVFFERRLYFACETTIRVFWPDGQEQLVLGRSGEFADPGPNPSVDSAFGSISDLAFGRDGTLYFLDGDHNRAFRFRTSGEIELVAGAGVRGFSGDGASAKQAHLDHPTQILSGQNGELFIFDAENDRIRKVDVRGEIHTVAGGGASLASNEQTPALRLNLRNLRTIRLDGDDTIIALSNDGKLQRIGENWRGFSRTTDDIRIVSKDGSELHVFSAEGRHLETLHTLTGAIKHSFTYDEQHLLVGITDGYGNVTEFVRDGQGNLLAMVSPDGLITIVDLDSNGFFSTVTAPDGSRWSFEHLPDGLLSSMLARDGSRNEFTYSPLGQLALDEHTSGFGWTLAKSRWAVFQASRTALESSLGRKRQYEINYTEAGDRYRRTIHPDGSRVSKLVTTDLRAITNELSGLTTTVLWSADPRFGLDAPYVRELSIRSPSGKQLVLTRNRTALSSDPDADIGSLDLDERTEVNGRVYTSTYDASQLTWTIVSPEGRRETIRVDEQGRQLSRTAPGLATVSFQYDPRGRLTSVLAADGSETRSWQIGYDQRGYTASVSDSAGQATTLANDAVGRPTLVTAPGDREILISYDAVGNISSVTPPGGNAHQFDHNERRAVTRYTPPPTDSGTSEWAYEYNLDQQLERVQRPDGLIVDPEYDLQTGRLVAITASRGTFPYDYSHDPVRIRQIATPEGNNVQFLSDGPLLTTQAWLGPQFPEGKSIAYGYDDNFWVTEVVVDGLSTEYSYDNDGLLTQAGDLTITRDMETGLPLATALGAVLTSRTYNSFAEPQRYTVAFGGAPIFDLTYQRDSTGRIIAITEQFGSEARTTGYLYDSAGRLDQVTRGGELMADYDYDANGNRAAVFLAAIPGRQESMATAIYDSRDRVLTYGDWVFAHTESGELQSIVKQVTGEATTYVYDEFSNLLMVTLPNGGTVEYVVDGLNRRVGKMVNSVLVKRWIYQDQLNVAAEFDSQNNTSASFIYGDKPNVPAYMERAGKVYRIISDHLGSPRIVIDTQSGEILQALEYDEYGNIIQDTNPGFQPFGFAGGIYDPDTGLVRFGGRDYNPSVGRWATMDPIRFGGGDSNMYAYAYNNPVNFVDPSGRDAIYVHYDGYPVNIGLGFHAPLGHAGVVSVDPDTGSTRYYEYGRYDSDFGNVERKPIPDVEIGEDGRPTEESLNNLYDFLSKRLGKDSPVTADYYPDADHQSVIDFAENRMNDPNRAPYSWNPLNPNNCFSFAKEAVNAGRK